MSVKLTGIKISFESWIDGRRNGPGESDGKHLLRSIFSSTKPKNVLVKDGVSDESESKLE